MIKIEPSHAQLIEQVCKAVSSRGQIQAYENVLISAADNKVTLTGGDGTIELTATFEAEVKTGGTTTVNGGKLLQALKAAKFDAKIIFKDESVEVKGAKSKFKLSTIDPDYYPSFPTDSNFTKCDIDAAELIYAIKSVSFIAPDNDVRHSLNGVYVGDDIAVTDGHRLTWQSASLPVKAIIPKACVGKIPSVSGSVELSRNQLCIRGESLTIRSKLIDGQYPDYKRVKGEPTRFATVNVESLTEALKAAQTTINKVTNAVALQFGETCYVEAKSEKSEVSCIEFYCDSSDQFECGFNVKYLLDALSFYSGELKLGFENDTKLIIEQDGMTHVIMGMRL